MKRSVTECDRCRREIVPAASRSNIPPRRNAPLVAKMVQAGGIDLCDGCKSDLAEFMDGRKLDEPP